METKNQIVPENLEGKPVDIEKTVIEKTTEEAMQTFEMACDKLRNPDRWADLPGVKVGKFCLQKLGTSSGFSSMAEEGDYISIDIPGPGPGSGDGKDWVYIECVEQNFDTDVDESFAMRVRPSENPNNQQPQQTVSHFFKGKATSTFIVRRNNTKVTVSYHGRNEIPNIKDAGIVEGVRNATVSFVALAGFSELQWTMLLNGLLSKTA